MKRTFFLFFLIALLFPTLSYARTWLVRQDGSGDCTTIQGCIDLAGGGDSVVVGPGTYFEHVIIPVPLSVVGELGSAQTTIDGGEEYARCVTCSHLSGRVRIKGFTLTRGFAWDYCSPTGLGGGISCSSSELEVSDCNIVENYGGGINCGPGSSVTVRGCQFAGNHGELLDWNPTCYPFDNYVPAHAVIGREATGTIIDCDIVTYETGVWWRGGRLEAYGNVISEPEPVETWNHGRGFALDSLEFASIHHNVVKDVDSGIEVGQSNVRIESNTVVRHHQGSGIYVGNLWSGVIRNNIVAWGGPYDPAIFCYGSASLSCNDVWNEPGGGYSGQCSHSTDLSVDPLFCSPLTNDFHLSSSSPCLNPVGCGQIGALGAGCGPTAVRQTTWGKVKTLFR